MATCIAADGFGDVDSHLNNGHGHDGTCVGGYSASGQNLADGQCLDGQGLWSANGAEIMPLPFWQGLQDCDQGEYGGAVLNGGANLAEINGGSLDWLAAPGGGWMGYDAPQGAAPAWRGLPPGARTNGHSGRQKRRFCTSYPDVGLCRRGSQCGFAHSREEICAPLLDVDEERQAPHALTVGFFMYKYKTRWCPIGVQHEWHTCVYAHNYQDARRPVSIGYGARLCPYWSKKDTGAEYSQRCPLGLRCPYSHGAKEQLYHPHYFKTVICRDLRGKACPRQKLCAFFHNRQERRHPPADDVNYTQPLDNEALPSDWIAEFMSPPFLPEGSRGGAVEEGGQNQKAMYSQGNHGSGGGHQNNGSKQHAAQNGDYSSEANNGGGACACGGGGGGGGGCGCGNGGGANGNGTDGAIVPYTAQLPGSQDAQFGPCPGQQPMVFLMPMPISPMGGMSMSPMQSQGQWVFVPIDGGVQQPS